MAEIITEDQPRIKFSTRFVGQLASVVTGDEDSELHRLAALMAKMERLGAAPILNDGQVAGNCAISPRLLQLPPLVASSCSSNPPPPARRSSSSASPPACPSDRGLALVSMSGKPPGHTLDPASDFVLVTGFERGTWAAEYQSRSEAVRPSSDSPLLVAALAHGAEYGWQAVPYVVLHGHALAEGEGLSYAEKLGIPISPRETLFSTPEDLAELETLFRSHPYPANCCYIRRGHGFFLLASSVAEAGELFRKLIEPWLLSQ